MESPSLEIILDIVLGKQLLGGPAWAGEVVQDIQRALPNSTFLWLCDSGNGTFRLVDLWDWRGNGTVFQTSIYNERCRSILFELLSKRSGSETLPCFLLFSLKVPHSSFFWKWNILPLPSTSVAELVTGALAWNCPNTYWGYQGHFRSEIREKSF